MSNVINLDEYRRTRRLTTVSTNYSVPNEYTTLDKLQLLEIATHVMSVMASRPLNVAELYEALAIFKACYVSGNTPEFREMVRQRIKYIESLLNGHEPRPA